MAETVDLAEFNELTDVVMGTPKTALEGGGRHEDGVVHSIEQLKAGQDRIEQKLGNGGIKLKLTPAQWAFLTAIVGLLTAVVARSGVA